MRRRRPKQQELFRWGGRRRRAGRKPKGERAGVPHRSRPVHPRQPLHVTLRVRPEVWSLTGKHVYRVVRRALVAGCERFGFRMVHHSVQGNHIHLLCEADDARALGRGLQGLNVRVARAINRLMRGRRGPVFADRYHARSLRTPTEVRHALNYVLRNREHHAMQRCVPTDGVFDPCSSAAWFDGWKRRLPPPDEPHPGAAPVTWLLRVGWRRFGPL
jgi:REP element-mobilizing transposase RayT